MPNTFKYLAKFLITQAPILFINSLVFIINGFEGFFGHLICALLLQYAEETHHQKTMKNIVGEFSL